MPKIRLYLRFLFFFLDVRISPDRFHHLVDLSRERLSKENRRRLPIYPEERLAITLNYLATGNSQRDLAFVFKIGRSTIYHIIFEICDVLDEYVRSFSITQDWNKIAEEFLEFWDMLHCIGALDGKHIGIRKPSNSSSLWYDYKGSFSMILLAVCDADYCCTLVDVGEYVSNKDNGILRNSKMGRRFGNRETSIPESAKKSWRSFRTALLSCRR